MRKFVTALIVVIGSTTLAFSQIVKHKLVAEYAIGKSTRLGFNGKFGFGRAAKFFFVVDQKGSLSVFRLENLNEIWTDKKVSSAIPSPNGKWLAYVSKKREVRILEIETGDVRSVTFKHRIRLLSWSPASDNFAVAGSRFKVHFIDLKSRQVISSVVIHKRKRLFLSRLVDTAQYDFIQAFYIPNSNRVVTICGDSSGEIWNFEQGNLISKLSHRKTRRYSSAAVVYADVSADGRWVVTSSYDQSRLWSGIDGKLIREFSGYGYPSFSPNGKYLALINDPTGDRSVRILDLVRQKIDPLIGKYSGQIVTWGPESKLFITDRTIDEVSKNRAYLWDIQTGNIRKEFNTYSKYCFDLVSTCRSDFDKFLFRPTGELLLLHNKRRLKFVGLREGRMLSSLEGFGSPIVWSSDGNFILAKKSKIQKVGLWQLTVSSD